MMMAEHPTPQTKEEMEREVLRSIRGVCWDMIRAIDRGDIAAIEIHHDFLENQWRRRRNILSAPRQNRL